MGDGLLEKNLKAMEKWYPEFADLLREGKAESKRSEGKAGEPEAADTGEDREQTDDTEVLTARSWDQELIFKIKKGERTLYLGGKRNAGEPIQMWLERLGKIHKYAPVFLFGIGSGAYLKALIQNTEKEVYVVAYEPSLHVFQKLLCEVDLSKEIENRPIAFIVEGVNETEFEPVLHKVLAVQNMEFLKEEIHPNYREFYGEKIVEKVRLVQKKVEKYMMEYRSGQLFQKNVVQNIFSNMKYVCEGYHTKQLSKVIPPDGTAILIAAGPSLNKNIQELKAAKNKAFLLAVDTAVKPLLLHGIVPDAFITIDPDKPLKLIEIEGAENIPVIAPATAKYTLLDHQKKQKIFYYDSYTMPAHVYWINGKELPGVSTGGSVACSGFSLLYKLGFRTIILVGQDLAYTDNKSHADGTFEEKMPKKDTEGMIMVKGNYQEKVPTLQNLKVYLDWFGEYIKGAKEHRNIRVVNATEGGAWIEGTERMTLKDIIAEVCTEGMDYEDRIAHMEPGLSREEREKAVEYLHSVPEQFQEMREDANRLKHAYQKLSRLGRSRNVSEEACLKQLRKIKKLSRKFQEKLVFQLIDATMSSAEYAVLSDYYREEESVEKEIRRIAKKGIIYSEVLQMCTELLKEMAEDLLLPIEPIETGNGGSYAEQ